MVLGFLMPTAFADVMDDFGMPEQKILESFKFAYRMTGPPFGTLQQLLLDLPLTDAHTAAIKTELRKGFPGSLSSFLESRGDFAGALESERLRPLDKARLLVRAGRLDEARTWLAGDEIQKQETQLNPPYQVSEIFRPLEDSAAWDDLHAFLKLLAERFDSPQWRAALWAEELDVAWHRDQLPALLEQNSKEPLRLAFFHHKLGNVAERDSVVTELLENAEPDRGIELLKLIPNHRPVLDLALRFWNRDDLAQADRTALFAALLSQPKTANFDEAFRAWLEKKGDALPLVDTLWKQWAPTSNDDPQRTAVLATLVKQHPDEPRFRLLLGRQLIKTNPQQAADLFKTLATLPLKMLDKPEPDSWQKDDLNNITRDLSDDLPGIAILGLGILNRQDLIQSALNQQLGWATLPPMDQARYLTLGKMDFALAKLVLDADFTKSENDGLAGVLQTSFERRLVNRAVPPEIVTQLIAKFDTIAAGSPEKSFSVVSRDTQGLLQSLAKENATGWKEPLERLIATSEKRDATKTSDLKNQIQSVGKHIHDIAAILPQDAASEISQSRYGSSTMAAERVLSLFAPPQIRRIKSADGESRRPWDFQRQMGGPPGKLPTNLLTRWNEPSDFGPRRMSIPITRGSLSPGDLGAIRSIMRTLGVGNPRRLMAEILIASDVIDCGDEALKAEAQTSVQSFIAGTSNESRGNEAFRYMALAAEIPENQEGLTEILRTIKSLPPTVRDATRSQLMGIRTNHSLANRLLQQEFGTPSPGPDLRSPDRAIAKPDEDLVKLRDLVSKQLTASPETIELAKRLLDKASQVESKAQPVENYYSAVEVLSTTGHMDTWVMKTREKLRSSGVPELEILLRLQKIDLRQDADNQPRLIAYAREIFALDPTYTTAAKQLVNVAAREGNLELLYACLRTLKAEGVDFLIQKEVLSAFQKEDVTKIFALVQELSPLAASSNDEALGKLHHYFLNADPELTKAFLSWLKENGTLSSGLRIEIAGQLLGVGLKDQAVDLEARAFVTPLEYPGLPYQFPPKPGVKSSQRSSPMKLSELSPDLVFLGEHKLFGDVIARMVALGGVDPLVLATFRLAGTPDIATFEREALPLLANATPAYMRGSIIRDWEKLFEKMPVSAALRLRFLQEKSVITGNRLDDINNSIALIEAAAKLPDSAPFISQLWRQISEALAAIPEPEQKEHNARRIYGILRYMLTAADDDTWRSYWSWREKETKELENFNDLPFERAPIGFVDPARIRQILPKIISDFKGTLPPEQAESWVLAAISAGDQALLEQIKALIPEDPDARAAATLGKLGLGDTMDTSLYLTASPEGDDETLLSWGFVGLSPVDEESGGIDIPRAPFTALDGKFDLQITAGKSPDRQVIIKKLSVAPASGHLRLKLTPEQRYVSMVATDATNGAIRWSKPLDSQSLDGKPIPITEEKLKEKGFEKLAINGPGGLPAWKIHFPDENRIDLINHPWNGEESVSISTWVSGDGRFELRYLDSDGKELKANEQSLATWDALLPIWQYRSAQSSKNLKIPGETVRLVLSASHYGNREDPHEFAFSNPRMEIGEPAPLPKGFERIIRVPGTPAALVISPDDKQLAVAFQNGKIVTVDPATKQVTEMIKPEIYQDNDGPPGIITWTTAGLRIIKSDGVLYRPDDSGTKLESVINLRGKSEYFNISNLAISRDAKWVASLGPRGSLKLTATDGSTSREITNLRVSGFQITDEGLRISSGGQYFLLKASDFTAGEPVPTGEQSSPQPQFPPKYRISYQGRDNRDYDSYEDDAIAANGNPRENKIVIPATSKTTAYAKDDILYYIDSAGNIVRGVLSPR